MKAESAQLLYQFSFELSASPPPPQTTFDRAILQQLVLHLLAVSIGFTPNRVPAMVIIQ